MGSRDLSIISINLISHSPIKIKWNEKCTHFLIFLSHQKSHNKPQIRLHFLYCVIHIFSIFSCGTDKGGIAFFWFFIHKKRKQKKRNLIHFPNFLSPPKNHNMAQIRLHFLYYVILILAFFSCGTDKGRIAFFWFFIHQNNHKNGIIFPIF